MVFFFPWYMYIYIHWHMYIHTYIHTYITLHYITLHYITLHYITLHYITLHYITLHYITLHYITYIHTYIYFCFVILYKHGCVVWGFWVWYDASVNMSIKLEILQSVRFMGFSLDINKYIYVCIYIYINIHVYIHVYIHIYVLFNHWHSFLGMVWCVSEEVHQPWIE